MLTNGISFVILILCIVVLSFFRVERFFVILPGHWEVVIIVLAILLLFGGKKIPELMKGLGSGIREFKKGTHGLDEKEESPKEIEDKNP